MNIWSGLHRKKLPTKSEQAYRYIRKMLIEGKLAPGEHCSLRQLAKHLGMSVAPIVVAVRKCEEIGLITVRSKRGIFIRSFDADSEREIHILRQALEVQAARLIAVRAPVDALNRLRDMAVEIKTLLDKGEQKRAAYVDYRFHLCLVKASGNRLLTRKHEEIAATAMLVHGTWDVVWRENGKNIPLGHLQIIEALMTGDPDTAEKAVRGHILAEA